MTRIHIVATGVANTASVRAAFSRLGCEPAMVESAAEILDASFVVLPGVGAFSAAMDRLRSADWTEPLRRRVQDGAPTLAICLGLQLLGIGSAEADGDPGLRCAEATAERFAEDVRVPHMGWNRVTAADGCSVLGSGDAYFAHSYRWAGVPEGFEAATCTHGAPFVAAVERGAVLACQFHPELSGAYGQGILQRWLQRGGGSC